MQTVIFGICMVKDAPHVMQYKIIIFLQTKL